MTNITQEQERRIACLGLMATESEQVGACPADKLLATFIEGRLTGQARQTMLAHLNHCPSCYYQWLEAASYLSAPELAAPRARAAGWLSHLWQRLQPELTDWRMALPAAALATGFDFGNRAPFIKRATGLPAVSTILRLCPWG